MNFTTKQKENISKYLFDMSKLAFGGLVIGSLIKTDDIKLWISVGGFLFSTFAFILAVVLDKGGENK